MRSFEEEYQRLEPVLKKIRAFSLFGKNIILEGEENFVLDGPNIIVGNHAGSYKDVASLLEIVPRQVFFTANKMIFNKDSFNSLITRHLKIHLKQFGLFLDFILKPMKTPFVNFVSSNIAKVGAIPVDLLGTRRKAIEACEDYLRRGKAIVLLQGVGRTVPSHSNPYVPPFRKGPAILSLSLYQDEGMVIPVTPVAMFGTHKPWVVPGKIRIKVGAPMLVTDYLSNDFRETALRFKIAMEKRVQKLLMDLIRTKGSIPQG
jgi:1-acyl-sn-glycerol-3-phosphate acyltransferase